MKNKPHLRNSLNMRNKICDLMSRSAAWGLAALISVTICSKPAALAGELVPFDGEKSAWHDGFERFDYVMDESTLAIKPFKAPDGEKFGARDPAKGTRRCIVVAPKQPA